MLSHDDGDARVSVAVRDNGAGLAADERERIFERFVQGRTRPRGTAWGWACPSRTASWPPTAARFASSATVPARDPPSRSSCAACSGRERAKPHSPSAAPRRRSAARSSKNRDTRILFVEDHPDTARMMTQVLEQAGYRVVVAELVSGAMEHAHEPLDLLVSDIGLPDGSGLDLMRQLLSQRGPIPGIALSGYGTQEDISRSRAAGFGATWSSRWTSPSCCAPSTSCAPAGHSPLPDLSPIPLRIVPVPVPVPVPDLRSPFQAQACRVFARPGASPARRPSLPSRNIELFRPAPQPRQSRRRPASCRTSSVAARRPVARAPCTVPGWPVWSVASPAKNNRPSSGSASAAGASRRRPAPSCRRRARRGRWPNQRRVEPLGEGMAQLPDRAPPGPSL